MPVVSVQTLEQMPSRGFQSSVDPVLNFGLGTVDHIDSLRVEWPGGQYAVMKNIPLDTLITLHQRDAQNVRLRNPPVVKPIYQNVAQNVIRGNIHHTENEYSDFNREKLIPKMISTEGPRLAYGDINGDGLEDFYLANAFGDTAKIFIQQAGGRFSKKPSLLLKKINISRVPALFSWTWTMTEIWTWS